MGALRSNRGGCHDGHGFDCRSPHHPRVSTPDPGRFTGYFGRPSKGAGS